jgi:GNAT superfamily N-acetyltransferase
VTEIRPYEPGDLDALYDICLKTGDSGQDATALYADPRLVGEVFAAPYAVLQPELAFVAGDELGVAAYVLGTDDTRAFEARLEAEWWPRLRAIHPDPRGTPRDARTRDQQRAAQIHRPFPEPEALVARWPAHLHINLLPRLQGQDLGRKMIDTWLDAVRARGVRGVHLGCDAVNHRALRFYEAYGWRRFETDPPWPGTVWIVIDL